MDAAAAAFCPEKLPVAPGGWFCCEKDARGASPPGGGPIDMPGTAESAFTDRRCGSGAEVAELEGAAEGVTVCRGAVGAEGSGSGRSAEGGPEVEPARPGGHSAEAGCDITLRGTGEVS